MPLPECRVELTERGWRHIGTRVTFEGKIKGKRDKYVKSLASRQDFPSLLRMEFSGRLWRDPEISEREAYGATLEYIQEHHNAFVLGAWPAAIGLFNGGTIDLIGVSLEARGLGLAERLIRHAINGHITAGTYSDNEEAIKLYTRLGMKETKREEVYHHR